MRNLCVGLAAFSIFGTGMAVTAVVGNIYFHDALSAIAPALGTIGTSISSVYLIQEAKKCSKNIKRMKR